MNEFSRRSVLKGGATAVGLGAIPFSAWFAKHAAADGPKTRYALNTAAGQAMLRTYASAVKTMGSTNPGSPLSWNFQWYTHWIPGPQAPLSVAEHRKRIVLGEVYPNASDPNRALANEMWDTCQSHGGPNDSPYHFLPWHRMYVYYLERIVRKVSGNADFTLPYWNYLDPSQVALPSQFRSSADPVFGPLYRDNRSQGINTGKPINDGFTIDATSLDKASFYDQGNVPASGFSNNLNNILHGNVHVAIGNNRGMGNVPYAANDPIFWMHHCNIDRMWSSWVAIPGRENPSTSDWLDRSFVFADENGNRVVCKTSDFLDTTKLNYRYDALQPQPGGAVVASAPMVAATQAAPRAVARSTRALALGSGPAKATLASPAGRSATAALSANPGGQRAILVLDDLQAAEQPGVVYAVYLGGGTTDAQPKQVGAINFFGAIGHGGHGAGHAAGGPGGVSFDVTEAIRGLQPGTAPTVTIAPVGTPVAEAKAVVGNITLLQQ